MDEIDNTMPQASEASVKEPEKLSKGARAVLIAFVCLLAAVVLFCLGTVAADRILLRNEAAYLEEEGMANRVSVGEYGLNVLTYGAEHGGHTIVVLSGLGTADASVTMRPMTKVLEQDNRVVFVDRAGYGLSDDTKVPRTNDQIVRDYRTALSKAGLSAPYVLLGHSIGGAYATYWQSAYPGEIEAVVLLDGTQLSASVFDDEEPESPFSEGLERLVEAMGWHRLAFRKYNYYLPDGYTEGDQAICDALNVRSMVTDALYSEMALERQNAQQAYRSISGNDIPKLYICASWGYMERDEFYASLDWINELREKNGLKVTERPDPALVDNYIEQIEVLRQEILRPYLERLGNCDLVYLPGDHAIYQQRPLDCAAAIADFLNRV